MLLRVWFSFLTKCSEKCEYFKGNPPLMQKKNLFRRGTSCERQFNVTTCIPLIKEIVHFHICILYHIYCCILHTETICWTFKEYNSSEPRSWNVTSAYSCHLQYNREWRIALTHFIGFMIEYLLDYHILIPN